MTTRAQLSQERSRLRRAQLLTAAISLFAEGGARAVTHRAVARRAGLPPATTTYYFASIDDLLREALREHIAHWRATLASLAGLETPPQDVDLSMVAPTFEAVFAARGPEAVAVELSIYLAATHDAALRDEAAGALSDLEGLIATWLSALGLADPSRVAAAVLALVVGVAMRRQVGRYTEADEAARLDDAIRALVAAELVGRDELDHIIGEQLNISLH